MELLNERQALAICLETAERMWVTHTEFNGIAIAQIAVALFNDARESERRAQ